MNNVAEDIMRVLYAVRASEISTAQAREAVEQRAHSARCTLRKGSDDLILLERVEDSANAYLNIIEEHSDEPVFKSDPALEAVKCKAERL